MMSNNNRRTISRYLFHLKFIYIVALIFVLIGSLVIIGYHGQLREKWLLTKATLLSFSIITALVSIGGLIGSFRLNQCLVLSTACYMSVMSLVLLAIVFTRVFMIPVLAIVSLTAIGGLLYSNALNRAIVGRTEAKEMKTITAINLSAVD
ncbi:uncharacterized protein LOC128956842 [Oppia nitens]|uniref:uncharacterized protein LOC128956842 n=1 Tax=Oppia nitens TaxID=1686743 RepID=UPI0023DCDDD1|nr:uncharacterized protein LOC128956842 [Oppia nitens]